MKRMPTLARIRERFAARPDTEHEQAIIRLVVGAVLFLCLLPLVFGGNETNLRLLLGMIGFMVLAGAIFGWICLFPKTSVVRRVVGSLFDIGQTTAFMCYLGEYGTPLYIFYLWTTFGNGFRYGRAYLYNSLALSIIGFSVVIVVSDYSGRWIAGGNDRAVAVRREAGDTAIRFRAACRGR
jgi:two-component system sensor histidine kinase RpfC